MQIIVGIVVQAKKKEKGEQMVERKQLFTCGSICEGDKFANCCRRRLKEQQRVMKSSSTHR